VSGVTYDTGALVAAEANDRRIWSIHRRALERLHTPTVPAGVLAQAWRGGPQPQLARLLDSCIVEALDEAEARAAGTLLARATSADAIDASVLVGGIRRGDAIVTSDRGDIERLANAVGKRIDVIGMNSRFAGASDCCAATGSRSTTSGCADSGRRGCAARYPAASAAGSTVVGARQLVEAPVERHGWAARHLVHLRDGRRPTGVRRLGRRRGDDAGSGARQCLVPAQQQHQRGNRPLLFPSAGADLVLTVNPALVPAMVGSVLARAVADPAFASRVNAAALRVLAAKYQAGLLH